MNKNTEDSIQKQTELLNEAIDIVDEGKFKKALATGALAMASLLPLKANINPQALYKQISGHEGIERTVYPDMGDWSIGIGFNISEPHNQAFLKKIGVDINDLMNGAKIDDKTIDLMYNHSLTQAWKDINALIPNFNSLPSNVKMVLIDMSFNLGKTRLSGFKKMLAAVKSGDFQTAADEMVDSAWYGQVKGRAKNLERLMRK